MINASSRTSRFSQADVGIDLQTVNISVEGRDLLSDSHVQLLSGVCYGLIGRNGVGKSVLLSCLADGSLLSPQLQEQLRVMYVRQALEQIEEACKPHRLDDKKKMKSKSMSLGKLFVELSTLEELLRPPYSMEKKIPEIEKWRQWAEQRSGARGFEARQKLSQLEKEAEAKMSSLNLDDDEDSEDYNYSDDEDHTRTISSELLDKVLKSMKITPEMLLGPYSTLSGGWKMRIQLAKAMLFPPDLLLLDEPTNHLDIVGITWLERCIKRHFSKTTILLVSHNRSFLNNVVHEIIVFKNQKLEYFSGNYDTFLQTIEDKQAYADRMQDAIDRKKERMQASIQSNLTQALKKGDDKKLKQVASKKTKLEERTGLERNAKGHRFKLNRDRVGYFHSTLGDVDHVEGENTQPRLQFKIPEPDLPRFKGPLLVIEDVSFKRKDDDGKIVFQLNNVTFSVEAGQRVALLGPNGQGKSTLLNLLHQTWTQTSGIIQCRVQNVGYFEQGIVHELGQVTETAMGRLTQKYPTHKTEDLWKSLGSFGLGSSDLATKTPLSKFSGGQRVAYAFCELSIAAPSLLLLDEPNSHLDLEALEALGAALSNFAGGIVIVSHDTSFVDEVATDMFWICDGKMQEMEDGLDEIPARLKEFQRKV